MHDASDESYSLEELERARDLRKSVPPTRRGRTTVFDQCPHTPACPTLAECIENIAWYLRHRKEIEQR
jgi:hypothetical protein